jgi:hypothetical protein
MVRSRPICTSICVIEPFMPPIDAPCPQYLKHGDPMHAQDRLTAAAAAWALRHRCSRHTLGPTASQGRGGGGGGGGGGQRETAGRRRRCLRQHCGRIQRQ